MAESMDERHERETAELEAEIEKILSEAKTKNERKRAGQRAEKMRRDLWKRHEDEENDEPTIPSDIPMKTDHVPVLDEKSAKQAKNRDKRLRKQKQQREEAEELIESLHNHKPRGQVEMEELNAQLGKNGLKMQPVMGDGHCLYRAVSFNLTKSGERDVPDYKVVRNLCADEMRRNMDKYFEFSALANKDEYEKRCEKVAGSAEWGDWLELAAISNALNVTFIVHRNGQEPTRIGEFATTSQLAFLEFFTTSGGHYNSVVAI